MSVVLQISQSWPANSFRGIKSLIIFGDSYSSVGYRDGAPHPSANAPLGVPFPGEDLWTDVADPNDDESQLQPNWVGHLISKYFPGQKFIPDTFDKINKPEIGPPSKREDRSSPILVYDYAVGGHNVSGVKNQVETQFIPHVGRKPEWAPWAPENTLFVTWVGINDLAFTSKPGPILDVLFKLQELLYQAGARNFLFIDVPPIDRSPAVLRFVRSVDDSSMPRYLEWNAALHSAITAFASGHSDVTALLFSSHATFTRILDSPVEYGFNNADAARKEGQGIWMDFLHPSSKMHDYIAKDLAAFLNTIVIDESTSI